MMYREYEIDDLPSADWNKLDGIIQKFEEAWERNGRPEINSFLPDNDRLRLIALVELIGIDMEYRLKQSEVVTIESYLQQFSELKNQSKALVHLISWECRLRKIGYSSATLQEYQQRFPELADEISDHFSDGNRRSGASQGIESQSLTLEQLSSGRTPGDRTAAIGKSAGSAPEIPGYSVIEVIGRGGMGVVYRARHNKLRRDVALKMILTGEFASKEEATRLVHEGEAVAAIHHPNIVQIYDVGRHNNLPYLAFEYVDGGTLADKVAKTPLDSIDAAHLVEQLARAVNVAHQAGVVHRDLKPANVLLTKEGTAKITDFGLAKRSPSHSTDEAGVRPDLTHSGAILGTPAYMAPEQADGQSKRVGPSADVYALGAILYNCLTARKPFEATTVLQTIQKVIADAPTPPRHWRSALSRDLETICLKCLEKIPERRYPSAEALADDLKHWQNGEPILARPVGSVERTWRWCRRNPVVALLAMMLLVALLAGTGISTYFAIDASATARQALDAKNRADREATKNKDLADRNSRLIVAERKANEALLRVLKEKEEALKIKEQQEKKAKFIDYAFRVDTARQTAHRGEMVQAQSILLKTDPKLRGWEFGFVGRLTIPRLILTKPHFDAVDVAFSPDGKTILAGGIERHDTPKELFRWGQMQLWNGTSGAEVKTIKEGPPRRHCCVSSVGYRFDGKQFVTGNTDGSIKVWDVATGRELYSLKGHGKYVFTVAFDREGKRIISAGYDNTFKVWDCESKAEISSQGFGTIRGRGVAVSPDGTQVVTCSRKNSLAFTIRLWDIAFGTVLAASRKVEGRISRDVAFSPDGKRIACICDSHLTIFSADLERKLLEIGGRSRLSSPFAFSPDGKWLAGVCLGEQSRNLEICVWDIMNGQKLFSFIGHGTTVRNIAFSPDGTQLVSCGTKDVRAWDCTSSEESLILTTPDQAISCTALSPDGKIIAVGNYGDRAPKSIELREAASGKTLVSLKGLTQGTTMVEFSPNGERIVGVGSDMTATVWETGTGKAIFSLKRQARRILAVAFSDDGKRLITGTADNKLSFWDAETGQKIREIQGPFAATNCMAIGPNAQRVVGVDHLRNGNTVVTMWDAATGKSLLSWGTHSRTVQAIAFSRDGKTIVTGSQDETAKIWEAATGNLLHALTGHHEAVTSVAFSPDSRRVITGGDDGTMKIWDRETGQEAISLEGPIRFVRSVRFGPNGHTVVGAGRDRDAKGVVAMWGSMNGR